MVNKQKEEMITMQETEIINITRNNIKEKTKAAVFYHKNCADGSCSAALIGILKRFERENSTTVYIPTAYGKEKDTVNDFHKMTIDTELSNFDELYVVDFSFEPEIMKDIYEKAGCPELVVYLDHHKSAEQHLSSFKTWLETEYPDTHHIIRYAKESAKKSGATLTESYIRERRVLTELGGPKWGEAYTTACPKWYSGSTSPLLAIAMSDNLNTNISEIVNTCTDYDLWIHANPDTMPIITGLIIDPLKVSDWLDIINDYQNVKDKYLERGYGVLLQQRIYAKNLLNKLSIVHYNDKKLAFLNIPAQWTNIVSDEINKSGLVEGVVTYSIDGYGGKVYISARSGNSENALDCAEFMSKYFDGGGHTHAAGGQSKSIQDFMALIGNINEMSKFQPWLEENEEIARN